MMLRSKRGFSLVELMIVVAIIGILAAIAIPNFVRFQSKARQAEARADLSAIYAAQKAFNAEWQQFFGDFNEIGYRPEGAFRYEHGFGAAGIVSPASYTGAIGAAAAAMAFNTLGNLGPVGMQQPCGANILPATITANVCGVERTYAGASMLPALAGSVTAANAFIATAAGNIDNDAAFDAWSIDQNKAISGPSNVMAAPVAIGNGGDLDN
ncbi:MAG: type IV pilin protein [Bdellovibrionales bacterium]